MNEFLEDYIIEKIPARLPQGVVSFLLLDGLGQNSKPLMMNILLPYHS